MSHDFMCTAVYSNLMVSAVALLETGALQLSLAFPVFMSLFGPDQSGQFISLRLSNFHHCSYFLNRGLQF